jgi:hypothetical protein
MFKKLRKGNWKWKYSSSVNDPQISPFIAFFVCQLITKNESNDFDILLIQHLSRDKY